MSRDCSFVFYFNRRRQWVDVYLWDVHPNTFERWDAGRWGYYHAIREHGRVGKFGELHFVASRVRHDSVAHELFHLFCDILFTRKQAVTERNEEQLAIVFDELTRNFWREYEKIKKPR